MTDINVLKSLAAHAQNVLHQTFEAVSSLDLPYGDRVATSVPLVLGSLDLAHTILGLLEHQADRSWVAALALQRSQIEYVLRAAYFAKASSEKELQRFRRRGTMPVRAKKPLYVADLADEAADKLGWDKDKLLVSVKGHMKELSSVVHGGREVLAIYTQTDQWGNIDTDWSVLAGHVDTIVVYVMLGMAVAMSLSPLDEVQMDKAVRPAYDAAHEYFKTIGNPLGD